MKIEIDAKAHTRADFGDMWRQRELVAFLVWRELKVRYRQTVIGVLWAVLQPLAIMAVFAVFFGRLARLPSDGLPYVVFFLGGLVPWTYFASAVQEASGSLVNNPALITKVYVPRVFLPVASILAGLADLAAAFLILLVAASVYGFVPGPQLLWVPAWIVLAMVVAAGLGVWTAAMNALYRDVKHMLPFVIQTLLFLSPVAYASSLVPERYQLIYHLNPMATVVEGFRWSITGVAPPAAPHLLVSAGVAVLVLGAGVVSFQRLQGSFADRI